MSLIDAFKTTCVLLEKSRVADGEGGWVSVWTDGPEFQAAIVMDNTMAARVAESAGMKAVYTVTIDKTTPLDFHDVFRRVSDGQIFRVTSDSRDKQTPQFGTLDFAQVNAEEWSLPDSEA